MIEKMKERISCGFTDFMPDDLKSKFKTERNASWPPPGMCLIDECVMRHVDCVQTSILWQNNQYTLCANFVNANDYIFCTMANR